MKIKVDFKENIIPDKYSKHAPEEFRTFGKPMMSFPFEIVDAPKETKYFCIEMVDYDAVPVAGFPFIHWTAVNIDASMLKFPEDYSMDKFYKKTQGVNSYVSRLFSGIIENTDKINKGYVGPGAPDKDHIYTFKVYATNRKLNLKEGFYLNEMYKELKGKIIEEATIELIGKF